MYDRNRNEPEECRLQQDTANKADFLTVHGLWPGLPKSIAARGVDERRWMRYGCATRPVPNMPEVKRTANAVRRRPDCRWRWPINLIM